MVRRLVSGAFALLGLSATEVQSLQLATEPLDFALQDPFTGTFPVRGDTVRPRMLVMRGCSGSSAIMQFARQLLRYHGIRVPPAEEPHRDESGAAIASPTTGWPAELLKPSVNWFYAQANNSMGVAMELANKKALEQNQTLFFKGMVQEIAKDDLWGDVQPSFTKMQIYAALGYRANMLDQVVCQVKDCFQADYGVPVDSSTGVESKLCFDRRDVEGKSIDAQNSKLLRKRRAHLVNWNMHYLYSSNADYKAKINANKIVDSIDREYWLVAQARKHLENGGLKFKDITEEDLMDFQTSLPDGLDRGVVAWMELLESLGVEPIESKVREYLSQYVGTYPNPESHSEMIYNLEEVKEALKGTEYEGFIREKQEM